MQTCFFTVPPRLTCGAILWGLWALGCGFGTETTATLDTLGTATVGPRAARVAEILELEAPGKRRTSHPTDPTLLLVDFPPPATRRGGDPSDLLVEIDVHQLDEAYALLRDVAALAGNGASAERRIRILHAPLVESASKVLGAVRPCVAIVVDVDPLTLAGGHSFETDLIQVLGAESVTHGSESPRAVLEAGALEDLIVDLILFSPDKGNETAVRAALDPQDSSTPSAFVPAPGDTLWLGEPDQIRAVLNAWRPSIDAARRRPVKETGCARTPRRPPNA